MRKKVLAILLALMMLVTAFAGCSGNESGRKEENRKESRDNRDEEENDRKNVKPEKDIEELLGALLEKEDGEMPTYKPGQKVINVLAFSDEVPKIIEAYLKTHPDVGYTMNTTIISMQDGMYQVVLEDMLKNGGIDAPDIYALDAEFVAKYTKGDAAMYAASYDELGIETKRMMAESRTANYAIEVGTRPEDEKVVALPYQGTGGCFIYRRSIAKEVWGTDEPSRVQRIIGGGTESWDDFWEAAEKVKQHGYSMVSGEGDIWRVVENGRTVPWIINGRLNIDPSREAMLDISKMLADNGYSNGTMDWYDAWYADIRGEGPKEVFGFFGPAWFANYTMADNSGSTYGDWAVCTSPVSFFWGGTWLAANKEVLEEEKKDVIADILQWITLEYDKDSFQYMWANGLFDKNGKKDAVVSGKVMKSCDGSVEFLGGQDMFTYYSQANENAWGVYETEYDTLLGNVWLDIVRNYTIDIVTREEAIAQFADFVKNSFYGVSIPRIYYPDDWEDGNSGLIVTPTPTPLPTPIPNRDLFGVEFIIGDWYSAEGEEAPRNAREEATAKYRDEIFAKYNFSVDKVAVADWSTMQDAIINSTMACAPVAHVVEVEYRWIGKLLQYGLCYDLATLEEFDFTEGKWNKSVIEAMTRGDSIYGMSAETGVPAGGIIWNKRLFEDAGLDPDLPYDLQASGEWTWSKFEEICRVLNRDINNDKITDIYATASGSGEMLRCLVASTGEDFIGKDSNGKYYNNMSSKAVTDAMDYAVSLYENGYVMPQAEGDDWDYYQTAFQLGKAAMTFGELYMCEPGQMYGDAMQDVIGFVMPPKPDGAENHHSYGNNKIYVIPACYDAETASRIAFAYNVYTMPTPGYEDSKNEIDKYYAYFEDARAVEETIELLTYDGVMYCPKDKIINADTKLSEDIFWRYPFVGTTPEALVEDIRASWDALIAEANGN